MAERTAMATIKLARGQVGYYDELSHVHLTIGKPTATIYSGTNCAQIRRSIKSGRLILVNGSLGKEVKPFKIIEHNGKYIIASNVEEEMAPIVEEKEVEAAATEIKPESVKEDNSETIQKETTSKEDKATKPEIDEANIKNDEDSKENNPEDSETPDKKSRKSNKKAKNATEE